MKKLVISIICLYQRYISPYFSPSCRYHPTCSEYAKEAVLKYGVLLGSLKAAGRILRCNRLFDGGFDPVKGGRLG